MRHAQGVMADFARLIDWSSFASRNLTDRVVARPEELLVYACSDGRQAVAWASRGRDLLDSEGDLPFRPLLRDAELVLPSLEAGQYAVTCMETHNGHVLAETRVLAQGGSVQLALPPFRHDLAIAVRPARPATAAEGR
jgi:hypothetical protein